MTTYPADRRRGARTASIVGLCLLVCVVLAAAVVGGTVLWRNHFSGAHGEITYEVTGPAGGTADVTRVLPSTGGRDAVTFPQQALPFTSRASIGSGTFEVRAVSSAGALTCRIVVDGKEAAKRTGAPGQPVTCTATVD